MIAITGASGQLGRLVIGALLDAGVPASELVAAVRSPAKVADLVARGVQVQEADYAKPDTLARAFAGVDRLLLISGTEVGARAAQHQNVVDAAQRAGIGFIAYTSVARAEDSPLTLAADHRQTEAAIRASGIPFAFLRNGWYTENYTAYLGQTLQQGMILGSAHDGRFSPAPRADYAAAAAVVIAGEGHEGAIYELGGDEAFTMAELTAEITRQSGREVVYRDLSSEEHVRTLVGFGVPEVLAAMLAEYDSAIARGYLLVQSGDLSRLIGRPTTPLGAAIAAALSAHVQA